MDGRLEGLIVGAATHGFLDCSTETPTSAWWLGARLRIHAYEKDLRERATQLDAQYALAQLANSGLEIQDAQKAASRAVTRGRLAIAPWLGDPVGEDAVVNASLTWYQEFAPELLKRALHGE